MCDLGVKWEVFEEKRGDFHLNGGFSRRKCVILGVKWGIFEEKTGDFRLNA